MVVCMDDETNDLIAHLCARIGSIMEDASVIALAMGALERDAQVAAAHQLERAAREILVLARAATTLSG